MFDRVLSVAVRLAATTVMLGWLLSVLGLLDFSGYFFIGLPAVLVVIILTCRRTKASKKVSILHCVYRWWKGRRLLPLIFLFTFLLVVGGSVLHRPNSWDGLSYHIPRVLYWTGQHHWYWISTPFQELNYTLPNYEWLTVPVFLATGGFHATVVIDWISFLLLPSLFFTLLREWGTPRQLAWDWMWIFPSGYLIAMQAGSICNDLPALTALLAALHCANRFIATNQKPYLLDALLAAGLCTGIKLSNLPLAGFVLIILLRNFNWWRAHRLTLALATGAALCVSAFIPLLLNLEHSGTILGVTASPDELHNPAAGLLGNFLISLAAAFAPPVFPGANQISARVGHLLGPGLVSWLHSHYPAFTLRLNELPQEIRGGLGLAITFALLVNVALWLKFRKKEGPARQSVLLHWQKIAWVGWFVFGALIISAKLGTGHNFPRDLLPWFPILLAPLIARFGCEQTSRSTLWRWLAPLVSLSVVPALLLTPSRPLIPPAAIARLAQKCGASKALLERLNLVYKVNASRADPFVGLKKFLPPNAHILALVSDGNEPTASWWKPYGSRRCIYLLSGAEIEAARKQGVKYVALRQSNCQEYFHTGVPRWLETYHAREIKTVEIRLVASDPPFSYTLARFDRPDPPRP